MMYYTKMYHTNRVSIAGVFLAWSDKLVQPIGNGLIPVTTAQLSFGWMENVVDFVILSLH